MSALDSLLDARRQELPEWFRVKTSDYRLLVLRREVTPHREAPMRLDGVAKPPADIPADGEEGAIRQQGPEALVAA